MGIRQGISPLNKETFKVKGDEEQTKVAMKVHCCPMCGNPTEEMEDIDMWCANMHCPVTSVKEYLFRNTV